MCILIHQPKDYSFTSKHLEDFFQKNPDGFGAIVNHDDERGVMTYKLIGKLADIEELYYDKIACHEAIIHFRMQTHGDIDLENCHPYTVNDGLSMAHNGILSYGNAADKTKSDTWHYIKDFIRPMLEQTPDALSNPYIRGYIGQHIGASNKFGFMNQHGEVFIVNRTSGVEYEGVWFSNTYAWTPWKHGYEKEPAPYKHPYATGSNKPYGSAWDNAEDWEDYGYRSPSIARKQPEYQKPLPLDAPLTKPQKAKLVKAKGRNELKRKPKRDVKISAAALSKIIIASYNVMQKEDYQGVIRWASENPMKCAALLYEIYGDEFGDKRYNSEGISDRVNYDPVWAADAIVDLWSENEDLLLQLAQIKKPNASKGEHNYVG